MYDSNDSILFEETPKNVEMIEYLPTRGDIISRKFCAIYDELRDEEADPIVETLSEVQKQIDDIIATENKSILEREYPDEDKEDYISILGSEDGLKEASPLELELYRKFIDELIPKNNISALLRKGYGCYGGDPAYECDWNTALECITKLYELTGEAKYANTLGYIYYYGRCWNGEPKYDEAFKYFSVGAAGYIYESRYKLADMFVHGYGVVKNIDIAYSLIRELYHENLSYILNGIFDCKFADIALRLGDYVEKGYHSEYIDYDDAYKYFLQADFAIKQRLQYNYYGDPSVAERIKQRLNDMLKSEKVSKPQKTSYIDIYELLKHYMQKYRKLQLNIKPKKNGDIKLAIRLVASFDEKYPPKLFITDTDTGFCGMLETLNITVKNGYIKEPQNIDTPIYFDSIYPHYEPVSNEFAIAFMLNFDIQAEIFGTPVFNSSANSGKKYRLASVYFALEEMHYDYLLNIDDVNIGDKVRVPTEGGEDEAVVANILEKYEYELPLPKGRYKKVIGKV
ncbi:MAG: sel1 repeat family protein [Firmicutes bacterium]|nr:sel1 repeat family protein [Bacillota bacterium]